jgi:hypothetical protein
MSGARPERTSARSTAFQRWHREALPGSFEAVDVDLVLRCRDCHAALALVEDTTSAGKRDQHMRTQIDMARGLSRPLVIVHYVPSDDDTLLMFRWRFVWPSHSHWLDMEKWPAWESGIRSRCECRGQQEAA